VWAVASLHLVRIEESYVVVESSARPELGEFQVRADLPDDEVPSTGPVDISFERSVVTGGSHGPAPALPGGFVEVRVDLGFGPTLADLQVRRSYTSLDTTGGPFGPGWSSWASCRLTADETGTWADWRSPHGQLARIPLAEGTGPGFAGRVSVTEAGMVATFPTEAVVWRFDPTGRVVETSRGPGTGVRFEWDGPRLMTMAHVRGRRVELGWHGDRIVSAS
jgi:hypothetical protein